MISFWKLSDYNWVFTLLCLDSNIASSFADEVHGFIFNFGRHIVLADDWNLWKREERSEPINDKVDKRFDSVLEIYVTVNGKHHPVLLLRLISCPWNHKLCFFDATVRSNCLSEHFLEQHILQTWGKVPNQVSQFRLLSHCRRDPLKVRSYFLSELVF